MSENTTISTVSKEAKDLLSRLLASENIEVIHQQVPTAYFDVKRRVLCLPMWKDMSNDLYDMLIGHEVSHALFTPGGSEPLMTAIDSIDSKNKAVVKDYLNVVEDARIERAIQKKFPGLRKNFRIAYREMVERDFFGIAGKDIQGLCLLDRLNIRFKVGSIVGVRFNAEEQVFADRMLAVSTWDEVVDLSRDLYEFCKAEEPTTPEQEPDTPEEGDEGDSETEGPESETGETGSGGEGGEEGTDEESEGSDDAESGNGSGAAEGDDSESGEGSGDGEDSGESMEDDTDDGSSADSVDGEDVSGQASDNQPNDAGEGEVTAPASETQRAMDDAMEDMVDENQKAPVYGSLPKLNLENIVVDFTKVIEDFQNDQVGRNSNYSPLVHGATPDQVLADALKKWEASEGKTVALMAKQFELKKGADISKRAMVAKTGILDTVKMVDYRWSEDIFRKNTLLPKGKNHGVMMYIDWSGSMSDMMGDTLRQLVTLAAFCRRVGIPFEAYAFTNAYGERFEEATIADSKPGEFDMNRRNFRLLNLLSSRAKNRDWNRLVASCLQMIDYFDTAYTRDDSQMWSYGGTIPRGYGLGSTPLDESIVAASQMVPEFQRANGLQIVNTFFLTDGGTSSSPLQNQVIGVEDDCYWAPKVLKKGTRTWKTQGRNTTETLLRYLSDTTGSKVMGMFLRSSKHFHHTDGKVERDFTENKCAELGEYGGYDNYFLLDPTNRKGKKVSDLNANATPTVVRNAFIREAKSGKAMRNLMSRIAECVAIDRF